MDGSTRITRRTALMLLGATGATFLQACRPSPHGSSPSHSLDGKTSQAQATRIISAQDGPLPALNLQQATGLIALHGLRITWASLRMFGKCIAGVDDCIGGDVEGAIDNLQAEGFRSFHIYGRMTFEQMTEIQNALRDQSVPPAIVTIDQEGGMVNRIGWAPEFELISANMLVRAGNPNYANEAGYLTGRFLHLYGINLNLAPFVDLHAYTPLRRFSGDPREIAIYAGAFIQGLKQAGVGACAKHFPDGSASQNCHDRLDRIGLTLSELQVEERYKPLIDKGLPAIMVGHDIFTQVDPHNPASLSRIWITDFLRGRLGFKGLIVTDALGMDGLRREVSYEEAIIRAFEAGADLLLANGDTVRAVLTQAVRTGRISEQRVYESAGRIQKFSQQFPITPPENNKQELERSLIQEARNLYQRIGAAQ